MTGREEHATDAELLARVGRADRRRASLIKKLEEATAELRVALVEADRARPDQWGWRERLVGTVRSLSRTKVFEAFAVADLQSEIHEALRIAGVDTSAYTVDTGTAGQVVIALSGDHPVDTATAAADRIREGLAARGLVLVPTSLSKPTGDPEQQREALAGLRTPGSKAAVVPARRHRSRRS
ncbi:hypothetical protein SUDANB95_07997 (plasmid) [Actinosynnema sp. ALI-1.44]